RGAGRGARRRRAPPGGLHHGRARRDHPGAARGPALVARAGAAVSTTAELVERARGLAVPGRRAVLGIVGAPGSGKSTLAAGLVAALGPERAVGVGMDGFHLSNAVLAAHGCAGRKGAIDTFDDAGYAALV